MTISPAFVIIYLSINEPAGGGSGKAQSALKMRRHLACVGEPRVILLLMLALREREIEREGGRECEWVDT